jgi:hypothetical protein
VGELFENFGKGHLDIARAEDSVCGFGEYFIGCCPPAAPDRINHPTHWHAHFGVVGELGHGARHSVFGRQDFNAEEQRECDDLLVWSLFHQNALRNRGYRVAR